MRGDEFGMRLGLKWSSRARRAGGLRACRRALGSRMRSCALVLPLVLVLSGFAASAAHAEIPHFTATFTCTSVTYMFAGFPNALNNTVHETVLSDSGKVVIATAEFHFNGPSGSNIVAISLSPGHHPLDAKAEWSTNGVVGKQDYRLEGGITCPGEPAFTIKKLQMIEVSEEPFTTSPLTGKVGQTVDYEIIVKNTRNISLTFSNFEDANCEAIAGGPSKALAPGESTTYSCEHILTIADQTAGSHENNATVAGTPPEGQGSPTTHTSNTVV